MLLTAYTIVILLFWVLVSIYLVTQSQKITYLKNVPADPAGYQPPVAVIIAVKDEEENIEKALQSVLSLNYENYRVIAVNDRSEDGTAAILQRLSLHHSLLSVINIKELPAGWLGKNNALLQGVLASDEEWILFTDADVEFEPDALKKAMHYVSTNGLDHLTALAEITSRSTLFKAVMNTFALMLDIKLRPWDVANPKSQASIGVGAFNLVRRSAYEKAGTHAVISLRPDDDLKLGERLKQAGFVQDVVYAHGELSLEWYTSLGAFVRGLMKNTFSVSNYQLAPAFGSALATFVLLVLPLPLLLLAATPYNLAALLIFLSQLLVMLLKKGLRAKWWHTFLIPFAGSVMVYIIVKSAIITLRQGGIYWRNSFYPLTELRKQA